MEDSWRFLDEDGGGDLDLEEWLDAVHKIGFFGPAKCVFGLLDRSDDGSQEAPAGVGGSQATPIGQPTIEFIGHVSFFIFFSAHNMRLAPFIFSLVYTNTCYTLNCVFSY